jgi:hypothetical protein
LRRIEALCFGRAVKMFNRGWFQNFYRTTNRAGSAVVNRLGLAIAIAAAPIFAGPKSCRCKSRLRRIWTNGLGCEVVYSLVQMVL